MPIGLSLHIGLNQVDPVHYQNWSGPLSACEADANDMQAIAVYRGFTPVSLLTAAATRQNVINEIGSAAVKLNSGDIFLLSYSGHGGQLPDWNLDEADQQDETWCLYDGQLVDDEIFSLFGRFKPGVRILVFSDSCHSGTVIKMAYYHNTARSPSLSFDQPNSTVYRAMPNDVARRVYKANTATYDPILNDKTLKESRNKIQASALLISGCQDNQLSSDGTFNGLFTGTMLRVWGNGAFEGNYRAFHGSIVRRMPPDQTPNYYTIGVPILPLRAKTRSRYKSTISA